MGRIFRCDTRRKNIVDLLGKITDPLIHLLQIVRNSLIIHFAADRDVLTVLHRCKRLITGIIIYDKRITSGIRIIGPVCIVIELVSNINNTACIRQITLGHPLQIRGVRLNYQLGGITAVGNLFCFAMKILAVIPVAHLNQSAQGTAHRCII